MASLPLTSEAVLALAPDAASAKAAHGLVKPSQWPLLGANDAAVWGECQGSGAKPYQTQVDFAGPAFRCSCPSRKFPCKHGLALLLMRAQQPAAFTAGGAPAWVDEWLASRADKAEKLATKATAAPADPGTADKREAQRWQRIETAALELQRWLADQVARGLGALDDTALQGWTMMARRMVDAQAPGLGQRIQSAAAGVRRGADRPEQTLQRLGLLQLASEALGQRARLSADEQADLRIVAGWPMDRDEMLAGGPRLADRWTVLGAFAEERDDRLTERRVWLNGESSGRRALMLDHAFGGRGFEQAWVAGTAVDATLAFFPGRSGLRALLVDTTMPAGAARLPATLAADEFLAVALRVADCPWVGLHPIVLRDALPLRHGNRLLLVADGRALPLALPDSDMWTLLAVSGGKPLHIAGEWDGQALAPLTAWQSADLLWQRSIA